MVVVVQYIYRQPACSDAGSALLSGDRGLAVLCRHVDRAEFLDRAHAQILSPVEVDVFAKSTSCIV